MKKFNLSLVAVLAMSTFAIAGGDIAPVEPVVEEPMVVESTGNFYLGLGYGWLSAKTTESVTTTSANGIVATATRTAVDDSFNEVMIQAGYKFNDYVAVEGRYWFGLSQSLNFHDWSAQLNDHDTTIDAWGIYVKPMYPVTDAIDIYALLGYGSADMTIDNVGGNSGLDYVTDSVNGFSWGLGAAYAFSDNVSLFVDYVSIYNDNSNSLIPNTTISHDVNNEIDTWNFGVTYNF